MIASVPIPTLHTVLIVKDNELPDAIFVVPSDGKPDISQYVRLGALPKDLEEAVRKAIWND